MRRAKSITDSLITFMPKSMSARMRTAACETRSWLDYPYLILPDKRAKSCTDKKSTLCTTIRTPASLTTLPFGLVSRRPSWVVGLERERLPCRARRTSSFDLMENRDSRESSKEGSSDLIDRDSRSGSRRPFSLRILAAKSNYVSTSFHLRKACRQWSKHVYQRPLSSWQTLPE
jgi:hypothetical protein